MNWMEKLDSEETKAWQELMIHYAYDSDDWNEAREQLLQLLKIDHRDASEADLRSYLSCCAESVGSVHPLPDLKDTVNDFYLRYGMENSSKN